MKKIESKISKKTVWEKHPDGGEITKYKFGSITRYNKNYQINYFGTIGMISENASSLANAKQKLDKISQSKIKKQSIMKAPAKKVPAKRKKVISAKSICRKVIAVPGINKRTGQLLKGWHYVSGKPVKVTKSKPAAKKKGLKSPLAKAFPGQCKICRTSSGSTYVPSRGETCDFIEGERCLTSLGKPKKTTKKPATAKQSTAQKAFAINSAKARQLVATGKAKTLKAAWVLLKK